MVNIKSVWIYWKKENNENKIIIKELITQCFCDRISSGLKKSNSIVSECTGSCV